LDIFETTAFAANLEAVAYRDVDPAFGADSVADSVANTGAILWIPDVTAIAFEIADEADRWLTRDEATVDIALEWVTPAEAAIIDFFAQGDIE
jgi:hypothetical protein